MYERVSELSLTRPMTVVFLVITVTLLAIWGMTLLRYDDGLRTAFRDRSSNYGEYERSWKAFTPAENDIAVIFRAPGLASRENLSRLQDFALEAMFAAHVSDVYSVFSLRRSPAESPGMEPVLNLEASEQELAAALRETRAHPLGGARLLSAGFNATLVLVTLERSADEIGTARETLAELDALGRNAVAGTDMTFALTGLAPIRQIVIDGILGDLVKLNAIGIAIGTLTSLLLLGSLRLTMLTMVAPVIAMTWVMGCLGALGLSVNMLTTAVPVLAIVLSLADSIHLTAEYRRRLQLGEDPMQALQLTAKRIAPACLLTSLTTAIAFAALFISQSELIRTLALSGLVASLVAVVAVLLVHPLAFRLNAASQAAHRRGSGSLGGWRVPDAAFLYKLGLAYPMRISAGAGLLLVAAIAAFAAAKPTYSFLENIGKDNPALVTLREIERSLVPTSAIDIPVSLENDAPFSPANLERIGTVHRIAEDTLPGAYVMSLKTFSDWVGEATSGGGRAADILASLSPAHQGRLLSSDGHEALVRILVPDAGSDATLRITGRLANALKAAGAQFYAALPPTGLLAMSARSSVEMIRHLNTSFAIAVLATGMLVAIWFRSFSYGLIALIPNVLPILLVGAWLWLSGNGLQFGSSIALIIAFGIAVDDTVHVINRLHFNSPPGRLFEPACIRRTFDELYPVLVITTCILGFGMLGTQTSSIPSIAYFGLLTFVILFLALLSVLFVLPALLALASRIETRAKNDTDA